MNKEHTTQETPRQPMSVLECLAAGFQIVAYHPGLMIWPVLLDLLLWLGPHLSPAPLLMRAHTLVNTHLTAAAPTAEAREVYVMLEQTLEHLAGHYNLFSLTSPAPLLGVPALMANQMTVTRPLVGARPVVNVASLPAALGWAGLTLLIGMAFSTLYLTGIGQRVIRETDSPLPGMDSLGQVSFRLIGALVWLIISTGTFSLMTSLFVGGAGLIHPALGGLTMLTLLTVVFFFVMHLFFVIPGMVQMRRMLWQAIYESILLTRGDFFNTSLLVLLAMVISQGFMVVWTLSDPASWVMLISIIGHAVIGTALTTALFIFYQERLDFLEAVQRIYAAQDVAMQS